MFAKVISKIEKSHLLVVSHKEDFFMFPNISLYKTCVSCGGVKGHNSNKLGSLDDTTYQKSRLKAMWFQTIRL